MALHDIQLSANAASEAPMQKLRDFVEMTDQPRKPFRRKAALREEAGRPSLGSRPAAKLVRVHQLPAPLGDPWDRLKAVDIPGAEPGRRAMPLVDQFRRSPTSQVFDLLRTGLLQTLRERGWKRVGISAPTRRCGATFTAVNLALSLARVPNNRTVLLDVNMRNAGVGDALGLKGTRRIRDVLRGKAAYGEHLMRYRTSLAIGLNSDNSADASETILGPSTARVLDRMITDLAPDVVLYDLPPVLERDDVVGFAPNLDGVILVADGTRTTADHIRRCESALASRTPLLGIVLNRGRYTDGPL